MLLPKLHKMMKISFNFQSWKHFFLSCESICSEPLSQEWGTELDFTAAQHHTWHAHLQKSKSGCQILVLQFGTERAGVWAFLWQSHGIGVGDVSGFGEIFCLPILFVVPLHTLILRIRDSALSLLILILWGEGLIIVSLPVSWNIAGDSSNFCAVPGMFPYPVGRQESFFPLWERDVRADSTAPNATCPGGWDFGYPSRWQPDQHTSAGCWELPRAHLWLSPSESHGHKCNISG